MIKTIAMLALSIFCMQGTANTSTISQQHITDLAISISQSLAPSMMGLAWHVGDSNDYNLQGGIINGTMHAAVREETAQGFWLQQDVDMGFLGKQKVEVLFDKTNGAVLELLVNDQKQDLPDPNDTEVVETRHDTVTVPKGTFDCIWAKIHDKKENQDSQAWINPKIIPISGMIKTVAPSQMGEITIELTNFNKQ